MRPSALPSGRSISAGVAALLLALTTTAAACNSDAPPADAKPAPANGATTTTAPRTPTYTFEVVRTYPHDAGAYTEGLLWHDGRMFESTGQKGQSNIREVDLQTGRVIRQHDIDSTYFGEGIIILGDNLWELTWQNNVGFLYDWKTFTKKGDFKYDGEGWALTTDGTSLIMSNGTPVINFRDPKTFAVTRSITVTENDLPVTKLNELEWIKGEIWANVWESDQIVRIDPANGHVLGWIDLGGILPRTDRTGKEDVLNGIAYDEKGDRIFVTGKWWTKLYEIRLKQKS